jgi:hypothetical protein
MQTPTLNSQGHSAQVHMELRLNGGCVVPLAQMGPDFVVVKQPFDHPPIEALVYLRIDDSESSWRVHLAEGISTARRKTKVAMIS